MAQVTQCMRSKKRLEAMTLIEMLVVLAIIAILTGIAIPSYQSILITSTRHVVISDLVRIQLQLETGYNGSFADAASAITSGAICLVCESRQRDYIISVSAGADSYLISADPQQRQEQDHCLANRSDMITLDHTNSGQPESCW